MIEARQHVTQLPNESISFLYRRRARAAASLSIPGHLLIGVWTPAFVSRLCLALLLASPVVAPRIALRMLLVSLLARLALLALYRCVLLPVPIVLFAVRIGIR